jgi:L-aminopeptidase/D-esterase-like protein
VRLAPELYRVFFHCQTVCVRNFRFRLVLHQIPGKIHARTNTRMAFGNSITDVPRLRAGHAHDEDALTGCTVILCEAGAVAGVDQRGGAPGTRETDVLHPMHLVERVHAVVLAGGSAYGLDAASGVMRYLEERHVGFDTGVAVVPVVPAAILFDLALGRADIRPTAEMGYQACQNASSAPLAQGNAGAGMGASVGKILGMGQATKAGIGSASLELGQGLVVAALIAVNALGDVIEPFSGHIVAGARRPGSNQFIDTLSVLQAMAARPPMQFSRSQNTVIGVVATNARLNKEQANKMAQMAQNGIARTIRPAHTMLDGDTLFALATGDKEADINIVGAFAAEVVAQAVLNAVHAASSAGGLPAASDLLAENKLSSKK